ncbi:MAG: winged helix-turn-helix domain-containing protein [Desulfobulbaceae bacterium]|nr:winged helix-turn-helix domain-containing protein [Desulfobulbaceae bacterium]HIJ90234.1 winged helix-turn-helix domain-containing protein [Deltaproteobacteria bacterium]
MAAKKDKSVLTEAGKKVGKALARSGHTAEKTGNKMKKAAEKIVKEAEKTVESAIGKVKAELSGLPAQTKLMPFGYKKEVSELTHKKTTCATPEKGPLFKPSKSMTVEGQIGFLAGDIFMYLSENGPTPVAKITSVMENRGSLALLGAALGWLAREAKISFSKDGSKVSVI